MADDYTPTTQAVRLNYITANAGPYRGGGANAAAAFDRWLAAHDAEKRAEWEAEQGTRRVFAAAYRAPNGRVISIGGETVVQEHAQKTVDEFAREDDEGPAYFLASRIVPQWVPVNENGETS